MNSQQIKDLIVAIDLLINQRIENPNDTFKQFEKRRDEIIDKLCILFNTENKKTDDY